MRSGRRVRRIAAHRHQQYLRKVPGIGSSRIERFGAELLEVIRSGVAPAGASVPAVEPASDVRQVEGAETPP